MGLFFSLFLVPDIFKKHNNSGSFIFMYTEKHFLFFMQLTPPPRKKQKQNAILCISHQVLVSTHNRNNMSNTISRVYDGSSQRSLSYLSGCPRRSKRQHSLGTELSGLL